MSLDFGFSEFQGALQNPNLCPIEVAERAMSLLESGNVPKQHQDSFIMTLSRSDKFAKRFVSKVNEDADKYGGLAREIAGKVVKHTAFEWHLRAKCTPVKEAAKRSKK